MRLRGYAPGIPARSAAVCFAVCTGPVCHTSVPTLLQTPPPLPPDAHFHWLQSILTIIASIMQLTEVLHHIVVYLIGCS